MDLYEVPVFEVTTVLRIANKGLANNGAEPGKKVFCSYKGLASSSAVFVIFKIVS